MKTTGQDLTLFGLSTLKRTLACPFLVKSYNLQEQIGHRHQVLKHLSSPLSHPLRKCSPSRGAKSDRANDVIRPKLHP